MGKEQGAAPPGAKEKERVERKTEGGGASHLTICHGQCCPLDTTGQNSQLDPAACLFRPTRGTDPEDREARRNNSCDFSGIRWSRTLPSASDLARKLQEEGLPEDCGQHLFQDDKESPGGYLHLGSNSGIWSPVI